MKYEKNFRERRFEKNEIPEDKSYQSYIKRKTSHKYHELNPAKNANVLKGRKYFSPSSKTIVFFLLSISHRKVLI